MAVRIEGVFRGQVVFQGPTGLPRDRYVNTFHFRRGPQAAPLADFGSFGDEIGRRLREFYCEPTSNGETLGGGFLSNQVKRPFEVRAYDLNHDPNEGPREPWITEHELPPAGGTSNLPFEMAATLSFYSERNIARRRGRIYLGPLNTRCMATGSAVPTLSPELRTTAVQAMQRLAAEGFSDYTDWAVLSTKTNEAHLVTAGWVDDDFDVQRGRGPTSSTRTVWPAE